MHDLLIRGGSVVDGTGAPAYSADIAIADGKIVEIGKVAAPARETIDADGALVTPGFIDVHTHYDGQFLWDDTIDPSFSHGVTTAIAGNCGVGFAPLRPEYRRELIELMEGVEDIPGIVLEDGLDWNWRSFGDYMDRLDQRSYTMDVATHMTHAPLRVAVMGERAFNHETATGEDIAEMARLVREGMKAGAVGFSAARIVEHMSSRGAAVPGTFALDDELIGLAQAMGAGGHGTFQVIPYGVIGGIVNPGVGREARLAEHDRIARLAQASKRPVTYVVVQMPADPEDWLIMLSESERSVAEGLRIHPQIASRPGGLLLTLGSNHPFRFKPSYLEIAHLPLAQRAAAMRDPKRRAAILAEADDDAAAAKARKPEVVLTTYVQTILGSLYAMSMPLDYEPTEESRVDRLAAKAGMSNAALCYDHLTAGDGANMLAGLTLNYAEGNVDALRGMLDHPLTISGLGDGGAHLSLICDASMTTSQLSFWARDRTRGPKLPVERIVAKLTSNNAALYGFDDRGVIAKGRRADINVIDFDSLALEMPAIVNDLPSGGPRMLQKSRGYLATAVNGAITRRNDADTGARPGRLIRAGR